MSSRSKDRDVLIRCERGLRLILGTSETAEDRLKLVQIWVDQLHGYLYGISEEAAAQANEERSGQG